MTREEAIGQLTRLRSYCSAEAGTDDRDAAAIWKADAEALSIAIAALVAVNALRTVQKPAQLQSVQGGQG